MFFATPTRWALSRTVVRRQLRVVGIVEAQSRRARPQRLVDVAPIRSRGVVLLGGEHLVVDAVRELVHRHVEDAVLVKVPPETVADAQVDGALVFGVRLAALLHVDVIGARVEEAQHVVDLHDVRVIGCLSAEPQQRRRG